MCYLQAYCYLPGKMFSATHSHEKIIISYRNYGNALDTKTGAPLFPKQAWQKSNAVLELACREYLSDSDGVVLYEHAGVDKHGLQLWKCTHGTNKVEGGPHGDIYHKF